MRKCWFHYLTHLYKFPLRPVIFTIGLVSVLIISIGVGPYVPAQTPRTADISGTTYEKYIPLYNRLLQVNVTN